MSAPRRSWNACCPSLKSRLRALSETVTLDLRASPSPQDNATLVTLTTARISTGACDYAIARHTAGKSVPAHREQAYWIPTASRVARHGCGGLVSPASRSALIPAGSHWSGGAVEQVAMPTSRHRDRSTPWPIWPTALPRCHVRSRVVMLLKTNLKMARRGIVRSHRRLPAQPDGDGVLLQSGRRPRLVQPRQLARLSFAFGCDHHLSCVMR